MILSHSGAPCKGKKAPLKKINGKIMKFIIIPKLSKVSISEAIIKPMLTKPKEIMIIKKIETRNEFRVTGMPMIKDKLRIIIPWIKAVVQPPKAFPVNIDVLEIGATSISFKKPNSLSQITETPEAMEIPTRDIATIPGNKNVW